MSIEIHLRGETPGSDDEMAQVVLTSTLTCPACGHAEALDIPLHY